MVEKLIDGFHCPPRLSEATSLGGYRHVDVPTMYFPRKAMVGKKLCYRRQRSRLARNKARIFATRGFGTSTSIFGVPLRNVESYFLLNPTRECAEMIIKQSITWGVIPKAEGDLSPHSAKEILVVEDDATSNSALSSLLRRQGWNVTSVTTVEKALEHLSNKNWVLLDLMLPDGDGTEVLQHIRANELAMKVAVMTGSHDADRHRRIKSIKPEMFLMKPLDIDRLMRGLNVL